MVSTLDFESSDPSSNLGGTFSNFFFFFFATDSEFNICGLEDVQLAAVNIQLFYSHTLNIGQHFGFRHLQFCCCFVLLFNFVEILANCQLDL
jgi:hypothetical protein